MEEDSGITFPSFSGRRIFWTPTPTGFGREEGKNNLHSMSIDVAVCRTLEKGGESQ